MASEAADGIVVSMRGTGLATKSRVAPVAKTRPEDLPPLTRSQVREINRRVRDLENRTRYVLVSTFTAKHALYYNVSEDVFAMNDPSSGTLFKRRSAAVAILRPSWLRRLRRRRSAPGHA